MNILESGTNSFCHKNDMISGPVANDMCAVDERYYGSKEAPSIDNGYDRFTHGMNIDIWDRLDGGFDDSLETFLNSEEHMKLMDEIADDLKRNSDPTNIEEWDDSIDQSIEFENRDFLICPGCRFGVISTSFRESLTILDIPYVQGK